MSKGFVWFAQNNDQVDYVKLSIELAKSIKQYNKSINSPPRAPLRLPVVAHLIHLRILSTIALLFQHYYYVELLLAVSQRLVYVFHDQRPGTCPA